MSDQNFYVKKVCLLVLVYLKYHCFFYNRQNSIEIKKMTLSTRTKRSSPQENDWLQICFWFAFNCHHRFATIAKGSFVGRRILAFYFSQKWVFGFGTKRFFLLVNEIALTIYRTKSTVFDDIDFIFLLIEGKSTFNVASQCFITKCITVKPTFTIACQCFIT